MLIIIQHDLPYSFVECKRFRELVKYLCSKAKLPSRFASIVYVINIDKIRKNKLKEISKVHSRVF